MSASNRTSEAQATLESDEFQDAYQKAFGPEGASVLHALVSRQLIETCVSDLDIACRELVAFDALWLRGARVASASASRVVLTLSTHGPARIAKMCVRDPLQVPFITGVFSLEDELVVTLGVGVEGFVQLPLDAHHVPALRHIARGARLVVESFNTDAVFDSSELVSALNVVVDRYVAAQEGH